jgi:hypothetical protein
VSRLVGRLIFKDAGNPLAQRLHKRDAAEQSKAGRRIALPCKGRFEKFLKQSKLNCV